MKYLAFLLILLYCSENPGPFQATVGYQFSSPDENRTELSSDYGYFDVYNSEFYGKVFKGDTVTASCEYMAGIFGGPYKCKILGVENVKRFKRSHSGRN